MKRLMVTFSDEAVKIWQAYQVKEKIRNKDDALNQLICEFGGLAPAPEPVQSTIIAEQCTWSGKKTALQSGSTFEER